MALPEVERRSVQDLADRWGESPEYVEECVRTFKFPHIILVDPGDARSLPFERHYYFDLPRSRVKALTSRNRKSYIDPKDYPEGFRWNKRLKIFIPRSAVEAFEKRYAVQPSAPRVSKKDFSGKTNSVRASDLTIQIVHEMYEYFFVQRKLERVTMRMIIAEIQNRHSEVSQTLARHIASIVKSHDQPGRPPEL